MEEGEKHGHSRYSRARGLVSTCALHLIGDRASGRRVVLLVNHSTTWPYFPPIVDKNLFDVVDFVADKESRELFMYNNARAHAHIHTGAHAIEYGGK